MERFSRSTYTLAIFGLLAAACGGSTPPRPAPAPISPSIAIVGATLWDGTGRGPVANAVTLVRRDRILCAGDRPASAPSQPAHGSSTPRGST